MSFIAIGYILSKNAILQVYTWVIRKSRYSIVIGIVVDSAEPIPSQMISLSNSG